MRTTLCIWAFLSALLLLGSPPALSSDDGDDFVEIIDNELEEEFQVQPIEWVPMITSFEVVGRSKSSDPVAGEYQPAERDLPGLSNAWRVLEPQVKHRDDVFMGRSFEEGEPVICAWRAAEDGRGFDVHLGDLAVPRPETPNEQTVEPAPSGKTYIKTLSADQPFIARVTVDIDMSVVGEERKRALLEEFFRFERLEMTLHEIDEDPGRFRMVPEKQHVQYGLWLLRDSKPWLEFWGAEGRVLTQEYHTRNVGCYALRVKLTVSGRVDQSLAFGRRKEVEGEIRFALDPRTAIKVDKHSIEHKRVTDQEWIDRILEWRKKEQQR